MAQCANDASLKIASPAHPPATKSPIAAAGPAMPIADADISPTIATLRPAATIVSPRLEPKSPN
jgi:hypothetical protein